MLGIGWGEMLVIAIVALVVFGPKELPVLLRNLGRMMGTVRRMSDEFRREIDKAVAADEIREARKAISDPLRQTTDQIRKEFNAIGKDGKVEPSGKLKPSVPGKESVVDEIRAQAGMPKPATDARTPAAAAMQAKVTERSAAMKTAEAPAAAPKAKKAAPKKKAAPRKAAAPKTEQTPEAVAKKAAAPKSRTAKAAKVTTDEAPAAKTRAPRKKAAKSTDDSGKTE